MNVQHYAAAIQRASRNKREEELDRIAERVVALLRERGHLSLLPNIVRELEKLHKRGLHKDECLIKVARQGEMETQKQAIQETVAQLHAETLPQRVEVDDTLIGGYEVRASGKRVDKTHKRTLLQLYNTLLTNN